MLNHHCCFNSVQNLSWHWTITSTEWRWCSLYKSMWWTPVSRWAVANSLQPKWSLLRPPHAVKPMIITLDQPLHVNQLTNAHDISTWHEGWEIKLDLLGCFARKGFLALLWILPIKWNNCLFVHSSTCFDTQSHHWQYTEHSIIFLNSFYAQQQLT